jgi:NADH-quinone oxidoreductase subunit J
MTVEQIIFLLFAFVTLGGGVGVVVTRNLYYAALYLIMSLGGMAAFFVLLGAGFLAAVQIIVYIGAIAILILFAIMLSRHLMTTDERQSNDQVWLGVPITILLFASLAFVVSGIDWPISDAAPSANAIELMGISFVESYLIPFMVVSVLLLVALVGGIILAREVDSE